MTRVDGYPAPFKPDPRRTRGGRRYGATATIPPVEIPPRAIAEPTRATIAGHLWEDHQIPDHVLDGVPADQLLVWHAAEHRHRTVEFLRHTHRPGGAPTGGPVDPVHEAKVRAVRDGKGLPDLEQILDRAAYAQARQTDRLPLSPYDRQCLEIAAAHAERNARRARRGAA